MDAFADVKGDGQARQGAHPRIVFVWGQVSGLGGTERRMFEVAQWLRGNGFEIVSLVWAGAEESPFLRRVRTASDRVVVTHNLLVLRRAWKNVAPAPVVAFGLRASLATRLVGPWGRSRLPIAMARNGLEFGRSRGLNLLDRATQRRVDLFIANSGAAAASVRRMGVPDSRIAVIRSGLPEEWSSPATSEKQPDLLAMVGNSRPEKNHEFGIRVFASANVPATLRVYTDVGKGLLELWNSLPERHPRARVEVVEGHGLTPRDYDPVAVLLHPSRSESLPRAVLEAKARGCFVIASRVGDTESVVGDRDVVLCGFDEREWSESIASAVASATDGGLCFEHRVPMGISDYSREFVRILNAD